LILFNNRKIRFGPVEGMQFPGRKPDHGTVFVEGYVSGFNATEEGIECDGKCFVMMRMGRQGMADGDIDPQLLDKFTLQSIFSQLP
jgi:hypothetical protein